MANGNSVFDEIREQHQKVKAEKGMKAYLLHLLHYYKWYALTGIAVLIIIVSMIYDAVTQKDMIFQAIYVNAFPNVRNEEFMADFEKNITINPKKEETSLISDFYINVDSTSYFEAENIEKLLVLCASGSVDPQRWEPIQQKKTIFAQRSVLTATWSVSCSGSLTDMSVTIPATMNTMSIRMKSGMIPMP